VHGHIGGLSLSELRESLAGHGVIGQKRIVIGLGGTSYEKAATRAAACKRAGDPARYPGASGGRRPAASAW
jgi:hypothetical protein